MGTGAGKIVKGVGKGTLGLGWNPAQQCVVPQTLSLCIGVGQVFGGLSGGALMVGKGIGKGLVEGDGRAIANGLAEGATSVGTGVGQGVESLVQGTAR